MEADAHGSTPEKVLLVQQDAVPLYLGFLEVDEQSHPKTGRLQVVDALGQVLVRELVHTLQLNDELFLHYQIGDIFPNILALVADGKGNLCLGTQTMQPKFPHQGPVVDLLQKSRAKYILNLEGGSDHALGEIHFRSVCIRVHPWPSKECIEPPENLARSQADLATDGHGCTRINSRKPVRRPSLEI